jgi:hypothetical protein
LVAGSISVWRPGLLPGTSFGPDGVDMAAGENRRTLSNLCETKKGKRNCE